MKRYITINTKGQILNVVEVGNDNYSPAIGTMLVEIKDIGEWEKIRERPNHYKVKDGKPVEKTRKEKDDEDAKVSKPTSVWDKIEELEKRIIKLEKEKQGK